MSQLTDILTAVKDEKLTLDQCERYRDMLVHIYTTVLLERAELRKKEAIYFMEHKLESDVATKRAWRVTPEGQRLLMLEAYKAALPKEIDSLRSRIYSLLPRI